MRKRLFAVLLTGAMLLEGLVLPAAGEELIFGGETFAEDTIISGDTASDELSSAELTLDEAAEEDLAVPEEELIFDDTEAVDELLEDEAADEAAVDELLEDEAAETITEDIYDPDDEEEIVESAETEEPSPEEEDILAEEEGLDDEVSAKWQAAESFQKAAQSILATMTFASDEPDMVGTSALTKNYTAALLKSYIIRKGKADAEGDYYFSGSTKIDGIDAAAQIYYLELYDAFYFDFKMNQTIDGITYVSEVSMTLPYSAAEGADIMYLLDPVSPEDPMVAAYAEISAPASYNPAGNLEFNIETLDTDLMEYEIQSLANDMLKASLAYWNTLLLNRVKVSLTSLRFDRYQVTHTHSYKEVIQRPATVSQTGIVREVCQVCSNIKSNTSVKKLGTIRLNITQFTYNGAVLKPLVIVKDADGGSISSAYYNTVYSNSQSKNAGTYKVTVTMKGRYSGSQTLTYVIEKPAASTPQRPKVYAGFNGSQGIAFQFYKVSSAEYYQIYRKTKGGNWGLLKTVRAGDASLTPVKNRLQYLDTTVKTRYGVEYSYSVAVKNKKGTSSFDPTGVNINRLNPPTISSARQSGTGTAAVTWTKVPCRAYQLEYCDTSVKPYNYIRYGITTKENMTVKGLKKGKTYAFRVRCYVAESTSPSKVVYSQYSNYKYVTVK